jgi:hypothetical protein
VQTNFGHEFQIPKQEKMSTSTCVWKHLICELQLKECCINVNSIEDVPLAIRALMWYMHGGAPAYFSHAVQDVLSFLNNTYYDQWTGREGPTA